MPPKPQAVKVVETGEIFPSARALARSLGGNFSDIYQCLRGERHTHLGYHYEYVDEEDHG